MSAQQKARSLSALVLTAGLLLLVMATARWQGMPELAPPRFTHEPEPAPAPTQPPATEPPIGEAFEPDEGLTQVATVIVVIVATVVALLLLRALILLLMRLIRDRAPSRRGGARIAALAVGLTPSTEAVAEAVRTGIAGALDRIERSGEAGDAIVAAWVGLEQSAAEAGLQRALSETAAEFAVRLIARREAVAADAAELLRLYERVRFGGYRAGEPDRHAARELLRRIEGAWR